mgnify:CR=1 FL=1
MSKLKLAIFASISALAFEAVAVPEFADDLTLHVSVMNVSERDGFDTAYREIPEAERAANFRSLLAIFTVKDTDNQPVFSLGDLADVKKLNSLAIMRLTDAALRINKMLKVDAEQIEKNS